ncbi:Glutamine amidotransferase class-I [anaerobic digester metagenome]
MKRLLFEGGTIMKKLLIIKTGSSDQHVINKCGDCDVRIAQCIGIPYDDVRVISVYKNAVPILPDDIAGIIITGSPSMVTDLEPWGVATAQWLKQVVKKNIPILGICFGHQLLAHTFGGSVDYHEQGEEKGEVEIHLTEDGKKDPLLGVLPARFSAYSSHFQTVTKIPPDTVILAENDFETTHALRYKENVWGVQFHPECVGDVFCNTIEHKTYGKALLRRFYDLAVTAQNDEKTMRWHNS